MAQVLVQILFFLSNFVVGGKKSPDTRWQNKYSNVLVLVLALSWLSIFVVGGKQCPMDPGLQNIVKNFVKDIDLKDLEGTWEDVLVTSTYLDSVVRSYSEYILSSDGQEILHKGFDYVNGSSELDSYNSTYKRKGGEINGAFRYIGSSTENEPFDRDLYFFYADQNVIGKYSCDPENSLELSWYVDVVVNVDRLKDLKRHDDRRGVMTSLRNCLAEMRNIHMQNEDWKRTNVNRLGLLGNVSAVPGYNLESVLKQYLPTT